MVAITVLLAATAATFFLGFGSDNLGENAPQAAFSLDYDAGSANNLTIEHRGGDSIQAGNLYIVVSGTPSNDGQHEFTSLSGASASGSTITAGSRATFSRASDLSDATVTLNWKPPERDQSIRLATWDAP